jgi:20S proteasome subunit beta 5
VPFFELQPSAFMGQAFAGDSAPNPIKMLHGTTTLGFIFQGGVIICVDSRASQGQYVGASHRCLAAARVSGCSD